MPLNNPDVCFAVPSPCAVALPALLSTPTPPFCRWHATCTGRLCSLQGQALVADVPALHSVVMPAQCCSRAAHTAAWHRMSSAAPRALWLWLPSAAAMSGCPPRRRCLPSDSPLCRFVAAATRPSMVPPSWPSSCPTQSCSPSGRQVAAPSVLSLKLPHMGLITRGCRCCHRPLCPACHLLPFLPSLLLDRWSSTAWRNATVSMY